MPRLISLLGLGMLAGGVLYWRKRNAETKDEQRASDAGAGAGAAGSSAPMAATMDAATPASTANAAPSSNATNVTAVHATTANPPATNGPASNAPAGANASAANPGAQAAAATAAPPARPIKGNVHGGRQLYHLPDDDSYDQVLEDRTFATVEEAEAAGFRHAGHPRG
jgi:hypothetical protein